MAAPPRKRHLGAEQRRALQLLASSPFGATEAIMLAHGFKRQRQPQRYWLATARSKTVKVGENAVAVGRVRITEAGRMALEG
jgi:hypothetical protein